MIESMRLKNFRKHQDLSLSFMDKFNLICGRNNAGKSTLFYAIEYCFFGGVQGFKKIVQLANFNGKNLGVEIIFKGRLGDRYRLQRMHEITGKAKSAKGYFTLKKILKEKTEEEPETETYLLSSDFGDKEENLNQKLNELTGISKRFFETGIHFHQGTIADILDGSKKLDIVFGITAATAIVDVFKERALEFEKQAKEVDSQLTLLHQRQSQKEELLQRAETHSKKCNQLKKELQQKNETKLQIGTMEAYNEKVKQSLKNHESTQKEMDDSKLRTTIIEKEHQELLIQITSKEKLLEGIDTTRSHTNESMIIIERLEKELDRNRESKSENEKKLLELQNATRMREKLNQELEELTKNVGAKTQLQKELKQIQKLLVSTPTKIKENEKQVLSLQEVIRSAEREKGDVAGILKRRNESKDKPTCEYCGAPIDPAKITHDIDTIHAALVVLEEKIHSNEQTIQESNAQIERLRLKETESTNTKHSLEQSIRDIERLEKNLAEITPVEELEKDIQDLETLLEKITKSIDENKEKLNQNRAQEGEYRTRLNSMEAQLSQITGIEEKLDTAQKDQTECSTRLQETRKELFAIISSSPTFAGPSENPDFTGILHQILSKFPASIDSFDFPQIVVITDELNKLVLTKSAEISATINLIQNQLQEINAEAENIHGQILESDKIIAASEKNIQSLRKKAVIAGKYREYQNVMDEVQNRIRKKISSTLEQQILNLHRKLSTDDEFEAINVDPESYGLAVKPHNLTTDEYYPAALYQGGGHKLILGLAYRLALGNLIGKPPLLLIDEPTEFIDQINRVSVLSRLKNIYDDGRNCQILLITHQDVEKIQADKKIEISK